MKRLKTFIRGSFHTLMLFIGVPGFVFWLAIHFNLAGQVVEYSLTEQLAKQLNTRITVEGDAKVDWFNQVVLNKVTIYDQQNDTLLYARRVLVAYEIWPLLKHHLVMNTCQLIDFDIRGYKASAESEPNYQFIIDALATKNPDSQPFIQELDLNSILLRQGSVRYDVLDKPRMEYSPIDPNHLHITGLSANMHLHDRQLQLKNFHCDERETSIKLTRGEVALNLKEVLDAPQGQEKFMVRVKGLELKNDDLTCRADLEGNSDRIHLNLRQLELPHGHPLVKQLQELHTSIDLQVSQLKQPMDSLYIEAGIRNLQVKLDPVGRLRLNGTLVGMPCNALWNCKLEGDPGQADLRANVEWKKLENQPGKRQLLLNGHCQSDGIELTHLLPKKAELGNAAMDVDFKLSHLPSQPLNLGLKGTVSRLEWRNHTYHDIKLNGEGQSRKLKGNIEFNDSLGSIKANFDIDRTRPRQHYQVDGTVIHFNPNGLNITNISYLDSLAISGRIHADLMVANWSDATGEVTLDFPSIEKGDKVLNLDPFVFEGNRDRGELRSPMAHMQYDRSRKSKVYHLKGEIPVLNEVLGMMQIPVKMTRQGKFDVRIDSLQQLLQAYVEMPDLDLGDGRAMNATLNARRDRQNVLHPVLDFEAVSNKYRLAGQVKGSMRTEPLDITIDPTTLQFNDEKIQLAETHVRQSEKGDYLIENFKLTGMNQEVSASGSLGQDGDNTLLIQLKEFDLDQIFDNIQKSYLHFGGRASGDIVLKNKPQLHIEAEDLQVQNFSYIDTLLGDAHMKLNYLIDQKVAGITCDIETDRKYQTHIDFDMVMGEKDSMDLRVYPDHLPLGFINNWTGNILERFCGRVTGPVRLYGYMDRLQLEGTPLVDGRFTNDVVGAHFHLVDTVFLEPNCIRLKNAYIDDGAGHALTANAVLPNRYLRNWDYDVNLKLPEQGFLVMDREQVPGRIYWGQVYAKGKASLKNMGSTHDFKIDVEPTGNSWFYLSPGEQDMNPDKDSYTFLTFRDKAEVERQRQEEAQGGPTTHPTTVKASSPMDLKVELKVQATEKCLVYLQMDPLSEDKFEAHGNGDLSISYDSKRPHSIQMGGTYKVNDGKYSMNVKGGIVSKEFKLQNTSHVVFKGPPGDAEVNLDCRYHIPSVNLTDLDDNITTLSSLSRSSVPVDCNLNISGPISNPTLDFDLEVKNVSDEIQAYVRNVIGTKEMMNQEVLYLLIFSKFYTPQYVQSSQNHAGSELTSLASSTITSQINQLLNRISNNLSMGTNVRSDKGDFSDMEMDLSVSTRLLGDRLLLNGNVGYRDPANRIGAMGNNNAFIGDFDIEYLINQRGTFRVKAYSHYNERDYSINNALTTQGIGLIMRKDFKKLPLFWPRDTKKPLPIPAAQNDSTLVKEEK